jgi:hypothetical protein
MSNLSQEKTQKLDSFQSGAKQMACSDSFGMPKKGRKHFQFFSWKSI